MAVASRAAEVSSRPSMGGRSAGRKESVSVLNKTCRVCPLELGKKRTKEIEGESNGEKTVDGL